MTTKAKRFSGKPYYYHNAYSTKHDAGRVARELRRRGKKARVFAHKGEHATSYEVYIR